MIVTSRDAHGSRLRRLRSRALRVHREESGQSTVLILGMILVVLMLVSVVVGATSVNLEARKLLSAADGAASAAAQSATTAGTSPALTSTQVRAQAQDYLEASGAPGRLMHLEVTDAWVADGGETAHVRLGASAELPILSWFLPAEVPVTAESHARVSLNR
ncbi:pilus assembly protein TadG-related protein [Nesterenkonia suensis]